MVKKSPNFRLVSELRLYMYLNTKLLQSFLAHFWHTNHNTILCAELVPKVCLKWSFFGLESVLNPIGKDTKKPQNYLIVCGLSLLVRFWSD